MRGDSRSLPGPGSRVPLRSARPRACARCGRRSARWRPRPLWVGGPEGSLLGEGSWSPGGLMVGDICTGNLGAQDEGGVLRNFFSIKAKRGQERLGPSRPRRGGGATPLSPSLTPNSALGGLPGLPRGRCAPPLAPRACKASQPCPPGRPPASDRPGPAPAAAPSPHPTCARLPTPRGHRDPRGPGRKPDLKIGLGAGCVWEVPTRWSCPLSPLLQLRSAGAGAGARRNHPGGHPPKAPRD